MLVFRTPVVIPTRWDWLGMLLAIGFCGFIYQVLFLLHLISAYKPTDYQMLFTMGPSLVLALCYNVI